ncbi:hypothetical protein C4J65_32000 [Streptomyces sp. CB09001]|nr:hypothetical protein C4J65_32000 [Streptomyces sp. CB09001]
MFAMPAHALLAVTAAHDHATRPSPHRPLRPCCAARSAKRGSREQRGRICQSGNPWPRQTSPRVTFAVARSILPLQDSCRSAVDSPRMPDAASPGSVSSQHRTARTANQPSPL